MLRYLMENGNLDGKEYLSQSAFAASQQTLQYGHLSRLKILFTEDKFSNQLRKLEFFRLLVGHWAHDRMRRESWDEAFYLIDEVVNMMINERRGNELMCIAAGFGCMPIIRQLVKLADRQPKLKLKLKRSPQRSRRGTYSSKPAHQSIGEAVLGNHVDVLKYLLEQDWIEAHLKHRNSIRENALHFACDICNPYAIYMLLDHFKKSLQQVGHQKDTPLTRAIK